MRRRQPSSTRTDTLFPDTTLFRSRNLDVRGHIIADLQIRDATATDLGRIKCGAGIQNCRRFAEESFAGGQREVAQFPVNARSEEHTSELQSLMRISYAVFCLKNKNNSVWNTYDHNVTVDLVLAISSTASCN